MGNIYLLFGCVMSNFGPLLNPELHSLDAKYSALFDFDLLIVKSLVIRLGH